MSATFLLLPDYGEVVYMGASRKCMQSLNTVYHSAVRFVTGDGHLKYIHIHKRSHITPILFSLHWLPIHFRIHFKILLLTFKALHGQAPAYISELLKRYLLGRPLRSTEPHLLVVPHSRLKTKGDCAFSVMAPTLWNSLPLCIRSAETVDSFKKQLKTYLFGLAFA